jgi:hypothetical protein
MIDYVSFSFLFNLLRIHKNVLYYVAKEDIRYYGPFLS